MKKILMALALLGLGAACKSTADVHATTTEPCDPNCKMECCQEASECTAEMKAECQSKCDETKTCPVTGKSVE